MVLEYCNIIWIQVGRMKTIRPTRGVQTMVRNARDKRGDEYGRTETRLL